MRIQSISETQAGRCDLSEFNNPEETGRFLVFIGRAADG